MCIRDRPTEETSSDEELIEVPKLGGLSASDALAKAEEAGLILDLSGSGTVTAQSPVEGTKVLKNSTVAITTNNDTYGVTTGKVPNLIGKTISDAYETAVKSGYNINLENDQQGYDIIVEQDPAPDTELELGSTINVTAGKSEETE